MEDKRLWCYGLDQKGNFYGNEIGEMTERWEALEKGEELARHENLSRFYIGRVNNGKIEDIEKIEID